MGCCLFTILLFLGPRIVFLVLWLFEPGVVASVYRGFLLPLLGLIFLPWTALAYLLVAPGGVTPLEWLIVVVAVAVDISSWGGGYRSRSYYRR